MSAAKWKVVEWTGPSANNIRSRIADYASGTGYHWYIHDHRAGAHGALLGNGRADTLEQAQADCEAAFAILAPETCPPSSLTGTPCLLPPGHEADTATRFHRYAPPEVLVQ